jgi:hypothetical protein
MPLNKTKKKTFYCLRIKPGISARLTPNLAIGHDPEPGIYITFRSAVHN